jgi:hypothetical protein
MLKSVFIDQLGNQGFPSFRPSESEPSEALFVLKVHNPGLMHTALPRLTGDGGALVTPSKNDNLADHYPLESGTYEVEWANDVKTTVIVEYVENEPRVHFRNHNGWDVTLGRNGSPSALPEPSAIPLVSP